MRQIEKSMKLNNVCYDIRGPVMDEANRMTAAGEQIIRLNIGNPAPFGFRAPETVLEQMRNSLPDVEGYSDSKGLISARRAILAYCQSKRMPDVTIEDIYTGNGVSELIQLSMQALLNDGDEVLVPSPDYPLWTASVTLAGGKAVHYRCDEQSEWNPDLADMAAKITSRTKAIVVINPNNPTGALYPDAILLGIVELARQNGLILFADEIYDRLVMDGHTHTALASLAPDLLTVSLNGLSKSHLIAGYRCGWMALCGDKSRARGYIEGINLLCSMRLCSNVPAQSLVPAALNDLASTEALVAPGGRIFEQRAFVLEALRSITGLSVVRPKAAFYLFPKLDTRRFSIHDDERFVLDFLREKKILLTHGGGFHWPKPDHFRLIYLPRVEELAWATDALRDFLASYRQ